MKNKIKILIKEIKATGQKPTPEKVMIKSLFKSGGTVTDLNEIKKHF